MQMLLRLPETPQPQEHSQRATNLQFFLSLHKVGPEDRLFGKLKVGGPQTWSHLSITQGTFQAVTLAGRVPEGSLRGVTMLPQINDISTGISHSNTGWGDASLCQGLPCSKLT